MTAQVFADEELEHLRGFPEIGRDDLFRFFTLTPADVAFLDPGRGRGPADRLGLAVALCTLPWLGFVPDAVSTAPPVAVARLADQLSVDPGELHSYGRRAKTRTEHLRLAAQYLRWRPPSTMQLKELDEFLLARAMEHDSPTLLFRLACEYLISARMIRPGPIITDPEVKTTRLRWLSTGPVEASPAAIKAEVAKLEFLRGLGADALDLSVLPADRRRFLATVGRRLTAQALGRRDPQRRYPILLMLLDDLLAIITDPQVSDDQIGGLIRGERIGWPRLRSAVAQAAPRLPRDHGHLAALDGSYGYLRQFTPQILSAVRFAGGTAAAELLEAVEILRELNTSGARRVPDDAPDGFVPARWRGYLDTARKSGNTSAYRHYWELCTLLGLRDGLRTGDVYVPGSRRYSDPATYLLTPDKWSAQRVEFCQLVGKSTDPARALAAAENELNQALGETGAGPVHRRRPGAAGRCRRPGDLPAVRRGRPC